MGKDFIKNVIDFKIADIPIKTRDLLHQRFLSHPDWSLEKFGQVSKAIVTLATWAEAQLLYGNALKELDSDIRLMSELQEEGNQVQKQLEAMQK